MGFEQPTEIQEKSIPVLLEESPDFIGLAQTGTGKTAAFGIPLIQFFDRDNQSTFALILAPTRELAQQIARELGQFAKYIKGLEIQVVFGGANISGQIKDIKRKTPHILVATPGRLQDLINRRVVKLDELEYLVLDEADEMLNMGFQEDIDKILTYTPEDKSLWLFSATMPPEIRNIVDNYMEDPFEVAVHSESKTNENISHQYIYVNRSDKEAALKRMLDYQNDFYGVVFCKTKIDTQELADYLGKEGYRAEPLHGDMSQAQRDAVMNKFRNKSVSILVATDVAARGIDVDSLTHVVHFSLPDNLEYYTHRSGRTARAGKKGISLAIVTQRDQNRIKFFERKLGINIEHVRVPGLNEITDKRLDRWAEKIVSIQVDSLDDKVVKKARSWFAGLTKEELVDKILASEFGGSENENTKDDLNISLNDKRKDRDRDRDKGRKKKDNSDRTVFPGKGGRDGRKADRSNSETFFINIGKIDNVHPGILVDIIASHTGLSKKQIGDIEIKKKHSLVDIDRKSARFMVGGKVLKYRGRKITIRREKSRV